VISAQGLFIAVSSWRRERAAATTPSNGLVGFGARGSLLMPSAWTRPAVARMAKVTFILAACKHKAVFNNCSLENEVLERKIRSLKDQNFRDESMEGALLRRRIRKRMSFGCLQWARV
jgi:hypothetical protein